jgi:antitoxin HicB
MRITMDIRYPALLEPQEPTGYCVRFPDLDEAITEGDTLDECLFNAAEVLTLTLEGRLEEDQPIPEPTPNLADAHYIAPEAPTQAALLVRKARGERSLAEVARALGTSWPSAKRLEDPRHPPTIKQLEKAAAALGKRLVLVFE